MAGIENFELIQLLGEGGMGQVFLARDQHLRRDVALKVMHSHLSQHAEFQQRFEQEAQAIARLGAHPNIVTIYSFHPTPPHIFLVMEFVPGGSLRKYLKEQYGAGKLLRLTEVVDFVDQIGAALDYAHQQNMIHRDVKPDNILLRQPHDGRVNGFTALLTDFGLVKVAEAVGYSTQAGQLLGTLHYMAPEQFLGQTRKMGAPTDLYALGVMLYELLVGQPPFMPRDAEEAADMHINNPPPNPSEQRNSIPVEVDAVVQKALAKEPAQRFQTGRELSEALRAAALGQSPKMTQMEQDTRQETFATYLAAASSTAPQAQGDLPLAGLLDLRGLTVATHDRLVLVSSEGEPRTFDLTKAVTVIGRGKDSDIVISDKQVSKQHAKITRDAQGRYFIEDLGSTNKTYLDGAYLVTGVPERWLPEQVVSIATYRLQFQFARRPAPAAPQISAAFNQDTDALVAPPKPDPAPPSRSQKTYFVTEENASVEIGFEPNPIVLETGQQRDIQVEIENRGKVVDHYWLEVEGLPSEWVTIPAQKLQLLRAESGIITITLHPPRHCASTAKAHPFTIRAMSRVLNGEAGHGEGTLTLRRFDELKTDMEPEVIRQRGTVRFTLHNTGNAQAQFTLKARDREGALSFQIPDAQPVLAPCQRLVSEIGVEVHENALDFIGERRFPFTVQAIDEQGREQSKTGELIFVQAPRKEDASYTVIDPSNHSHKVRLAAELPAIELIETLRSQLQLPVGEYFLVNGKNEARFKPGETLADVGLASGGVIILVKSQSYAPIPEPILPESKPPAPATLKEDALYKVIDTRNRNLTLRLPRDMSALQLAERLRQEFLLPAGDYYLVNGKTEMRLPAHQTLDGVGMEDGGVIFLRQEPSPAPVMPPQSTYSAGVPSPYYPGGQAGADPAAVPGFSPFYTPQAQAVPVRQSIAWAWITLLALCGVALAIIGMSFSPVFDCDGEDFCFVEDGFRLVDPDPFKEGIEEGLRFDHHLFTFPLFGMTAVAALAAIFRRGLLPASLAVMGFTYNLHNVFRQGLLGTENFSFEIGWWLMFGGAAVMVAAGLWNALDHRRERLPLQVRRSLFIAGVGLALLMVGAFTPAICSEGDNDCDIEESGFFVTRRFEDVDFNEGLAANFLGNYLLILGALSVFPVVNGRGLSIMTLGFGAYVGYMFYVLLTGPAADNNEAKIAWLLFGVGLVLMGLAAFINWVTAPRQVYG